ncbi:MAG: hypothetical protein F6K41_19775 [Symploca sp. SIO3E6]|nr:hypothetical protein [Caldora sp. SIO3E6]
MPISDVTVEEVITLVEQLSLEGKKAVFEVIQKELLEQDNPWLKLFSKYQDDPHFDQMLADEEAAKSDYQGNQVNLTQDEDILEEAWLLAASQNSVFDDLHAQEEDIYSLSDGKPFHD